jgi:hypothetical protein
MAKGWLIYSYYGGPDFPKLSLSSLKLCIDAAEMYPYIIYIFSSSIGLLELLRPAKMSTFINQLSSMGKSLKPGCRSSMT